MTVTTSLPLVDAVRRELEVTASGESGDLAVVRTLATHLSRSPGQLWPLLTTPDALERWFGGVSGDFREQGSLSGPAGAHGRIERVQAPHLLSLRWGRDGALDPLLLRLDPEDDGTTLLSLRHTRVMSREDHEREGPGADVIDWEIALLGLAAQTQGWSAGLLLDVPTPDPAWIAGAEGQAHVRAWAVRWAAEAVAAGAPESLARRGERAAVAAHRA